VERAKLDVSQQEILSQIDGAEKKLVLADAEQKLREVEARLKSDQVSSQAVINGKVQARAKALADVRRTEADIASMTFAGTGRRRGHSLSQLARRRLLL